MVAMAILLTGLSVTATLLLLHVGVLPLIFKYSKAVKRKIVFSHGINNPRNLDYANPASSDVVGGRNLNIIFHSYIDKCPIKLGIWHIVPKSLFPEVFIVHGFVNIDDRLHSSLKKTTKPVLLYCHGNGNHRASWNRLQTYKVFQDLDFHVITFDYRGYGDSTQVRPTERGVVEDALAVYSWLLETLDEKNRPMVLIWGHSLGSAIASNMVANLSQMSRQRGKYLPPPDALVLEAPFNNLVEEISSHPLTKLVSWLPYYQETFIKPIEVSSEYSFETDRHLCRVPDIPILILHCKADTIVPYSLAVKLHKKVAASRNASSAPLLFHSFEPGHGVFGLGHNNLFEAPEIKLVVQSFVSMVHRRKMLPHPKFATS